MVILEEVLDQVKDSSDLQNLLSGQADLNVISCDSKSSQIFEHKACFGKAATQSQEQSPVVPCHRAILALMIKCIATKPSLVNDDVKQQLVDLFKKHNLKAEGLVCHNVLIMLYNESNSQTTTWIKYESLLARLIQEHIYGPQTMADEVLAVVKYELNPKVAAKFSPVLSTCAKICRKVNNKQASDDELDGKWCEIIDWVGWLISGAEDNMDDD